MNSIDSTDAIDAIDDIDQRVAHSLLPLAWTQLNETSQASQADRRVMPWT